MAAARGVPTSSTLSLPHTSTCVRTARKRIATELVDRGVAQPAIDDAVLVLSELLSNALKHARPLPGGSVRVCWQLTSFGKLYLEVTDGGGPTRPNPAETAVGLRSLSAHGGRGLGIIAALSEEWGVRDCGDDKTVWAALAVRARPVRRGHRPQRRLVSVTGGPDDGCPDD
jgi:anti-sigma regulatory factor (Ser/Thr protein kinase)